MSKTRELSAKNIAEALATLTLEEKRDILLPKYNRLRETIITHFGNEVWKCTNYCLSAIATLSLKEMNGCTVLILVSPPSTNKTTVLSFFYDSYIVELQDDFTPASFVSHAANIKKDQLEKNDLLPKIQNRALVTPELASIFETSKDKLIDIIGTLTRILDGDGYTRSTGLHGSRGYKGDYKFAWLGAAARIDQRVWKLLGNCGNRFFFYTINTPPIKNNDIAEEFLKGEYAEKVKICRDAVTQFLNSYFKYFPQRSVEWDREQDRISQLYSKSVVPFAVLVAKLRANIQVWKDDMGNIESTIPIIEGPQRATNALLNFGRGHALLNCRNYLMTEDMDIVHDIALSSVPRARKKLLELLHHYENLATTTLSAALRVNKDTALGYMDKFHLLGVAKKESISHQNDNGTTITQYFLRINSEILELLHAHTSGKTRNLPLSGKFQGVDGENKGVSK